MTRTRKILWSAGAATLLIALALTAWILIGHPGSSPLENWIGRQIVGVLESYVTPRIQFAQLRYIAPRTVIIEGLTFTAGDEPILAVPRLELELAEIPRTDQPIQIRNVRIDRPNVRLVQQESGTIAGWGEFVRPEIRQDPRSAPPGRKFSDILVLRHLSITGGRVTYEPGGGRSSMLIPGIELSLETPPVEGEPGWYAFAGTLSRTPILTASFDGRLNLDTVLLRVGKLDVSARLQEDQYATLPPNVQELLREHQVQGDLRLSFAGDVPLDAVEKTTARVEATLQNARFAAAGVTVPLESLTCSTSLPGGELRLALGGLDIRASDWGRFSLEHAVLESPGFPSDGTPWRVRRLELHRPHVTLAEASGKRPASSSTRPAGGMQDDYSDLLKAFVIDALLIRDAGATWGQAADGSQVTIDGVDADAVIRPETNRLLLESSLAWRQFLRGTLSMTMLPAGPQLEVSSLQLTGKLSELRSAGLPDAIQTLLKRYEPAGNAVLTASGRVDLSDPSRAGGTIDLRVTDGAARIGKSGLTVNSLQANVELPAGRCRIALDKPALRSGETRFAMASRLDLLVSFPPSGKDIQLDELSVVDLDARFLRTDDNSMEGWSGLSNDSNRSPGDAPLTLPRRIRLANARVRYETNEGVAGYEKFGAELTTSPISGSREVEIRGTIGRESELSLKVDGRYDPGTSVLSLQPLELDAMLREPQFGLLPPQPRAILKKHGVAGRLRGKIAGHVPTGGDGAVRLDADLTLSDAGMVFAGMNWRSDRIALAGTLPGGPVRVRAERLDAAPGRAAPILSVPRLVCDIPELPADGRSFVIQRLELDAPRVSFVQNRAGDFVGWSGLGETGAAEEPSNPPIVHELQIRKGELLYDAGDGSEPMSLPDINVSLETPPISDRPGWYSIRGIVRRDPVLDASFDGRLDFPRATIELERFTLRASLGEAQYQTLPPALQNFLRSREVRGQLDLACSGTVRLSDPVGSEIRVESDLRNARFATGDVAWPIDQLATTASLADRRVDARYEARLLGGSARGEAGIGLEGEQPFRVTWDVQGTRIEQALRVVQGGTPSHSGRLAASGRLTGKLDAPNAALAGNGNLQVSDGRLINLPIVRELTDLLARARIMPQPATADRARVTFLINPDRITISEMEVATALAVFTGSGDVFFDNRVDMDIRASILGRLEETLKGVGDLGELGNRILNIGGAIGQVADRVVTYEVHGTLSDPRIRIKPLSLGP